MNRLASEKSPYLLQHADNPVDWYPWGEEAFERARLEDKPIFLSIGYATCHWCHVMEHESFEDPGVAGLLNDAFVSIKLDREERPDIDSVYMTACQLMTGQGGWPLTIVMTPDKQPFFAGTYFPRETRHGRVGMLELIPRLRGLWDARRSEVLASATAAIEAVRKVGRETARPGGEPALDLGVLETGYSRLRARFDPHQGGFGRAPKFPTPHQLLFLLRWHDRTGDPEPLAMVEKTLTMMRRGGIYDHVGYGFHRYSTDARWIVPHFEKMLYDQALLSLVYAETWRITGDDRYRRVAEEVLEYVSRDLSHPDGGFYSAEDADSEGREGTFYVWTVEELDHELGTRLGPEQAALARDVFCASRRGNFAEESTARMTGENILYRRRSLPELAAASGRSPEELREDLAAIRSALLAVRSTRPRPLLDDKVLTDWNGLMIAALAVTSRLTGRPEHAARAARAAEFILTRLRGEDGRLLHRYRDSDASIRAGAADYAFLAWGLVELYEATFEVGWLEEARALIGGLKDRFGDSSAGGFYSSAEDVRDVPVRQKESYDGAIPSANGAAWYVLNRLTRLTGDRELARLATETGQAFASSVRTAPEAHTMWLVALDLELGPSCEVVLVEPPGGGDTAKLVEAMRDRFRPRTSVLLKREGTEEAERLARVAPFSAPHRSVDGRGVAYVCRGFVCQPPTADVGEMLDQLG